MTPTAFLICMALLAVFDLYQIGLAIKTFRDDNRVAK